MEEEDLGHAALVRDGLLLSEEVCQHLRGSDCGIAEVCDGQVSQQKIHGRVEPGIRGHCDHDEEVSHDSGDINKQEHQKQDELELLRL